MKVSTSLGIFRNIIVVTTVIEEFPEMSPGPIKLKIDGRNVKSETPLILSSLLDVLPYSGDSNLTNKIHSFDQFYLPPDLRATGER